MQKPRWLPNVISILRFLALFPYGFLFLNNGDRRIIFAIALFVIFSDWLDGFLARKLRVESKTGEVLDSVSDGLFFFSSWIFFYIEKKYSLPLLTLILIPRLALGLSILIYRLMYKKWNTKHYYGGKIAATFYFLLVAWLILELPFQTHALWATLIIGHLGSIWSEVERYRP